MSRKLKGCNNHDSFTLDISWNCTIMRTPYALDILGSQHLNFFSISRKTLNKNHPEITQQTHRRISLGEWRISTWVQHFSASGTDYHQHVGICAAAYRSSYSKRLKCLSTPLWELRLSPLYHKNSDEFYIVISDRIIFHNSKVLWLWSHWCLMLKANLKTQIRSEAVGTCKKLVEIIQKYL